MSPCTFMIIAWRVTRFVPKPSGTSRFSTHQTPCLCVGLSPPCELLGSGHWAVFASPALSTERGNDKELSDSSPQQHTTLVFSFVLALATWSRGARTHACHRHTWPARLGQRQGGRRRKEDIPVWGHRRPGLTWGAPARPLAGCF